MAYISQDKKKELAPNIKAVLKKYNMKGSIRIEHHSVLHVNIKSGDLDVIGNYRNTLANRGHSWDDHHRNRWITNPDTYHQGVHYHLNENYSGEVLNFMEELLAAMMEGNHDNSDSMTDYFDVGWYAYINVGNWEKPYILTGEPEAKSERLLDLEARFSEKVVA